MRIKKQVLWQHSASLFTIETENAGGSLFIKLNNA